MKRVQVELSPRDWPDEVREAFENALLPMFACGLVNGMRMEWWIEVDASNDKRIYMWRAWDGIGHYAYAFDPHEAGVDGIAW